MINTQCPRSFPNFFENAATAPAAALMVLTMCTVAPINKMRKMTGDAACIPWGMTVKKSSRLIYFFSTT